MNKKLLAIIASSALCMPMIAQTDMCVIKKNGEIVKFDVADVEEVIYQKRGDSPITETPSVEASTSDLRYFILNDNEVEVTGFIIGSANIVVPERVSINGKTYVVTSIGEEAFLEQKRIKTVTLPNTIKTIGNDAFEGCENLTSVNLPEGLESIGIGAFLECGLKSIDIPSSVTYIGDGAFEDCNSIQQPRVLVYDNGTKCYGWIGDKEKCTSIVIPDGVTVIGEDAFGKCENLSSVVIPSSVTTIEQEAFYSCNSLRELTIPSSVSKIGMYAFYNCDKLDVIIDNLQENVKFYDFEENEEDLEVTMDDSKAFYGCKSVKFKENPNFGAGTGVTNASTKIQVFAGESYSAIGDVNSFDFIVKSVEGSYTTKDQVVIIEIDGKDYELSDAGYSFLLWNSNQGFYTSSTVIAKERAGDVVMVLACAMSSADYTIISPSEHPSVASVGAMETKYYSKTGDTVLEKITSITAKAGDVYSISNSKLNLESTMTIDRIEGTTVTLTISGLGAVTVGSAATDKSYVLVNSDGELVAASFAEAKANPKNVLFVCKENFILVSGTLAKSVDISDAAGETTFVKQ